LFKTKDILNKTRKGKYEERMRSFGLWFSKKEEIKEDPEFSVHINFWSESVRKDQADPDLDVGIKIKDFKIIEKVVFHCPFVVEKDSITDLFPKLCVLQNADLIFNTNGSLNNKDSYSVYSFANGTSEEKLLLFQLNHPNLEMMYNLNTQDNKTDIEFDFTKFNAVISNNSDYNDIHEVYIRFRIQSENMKNTIYFDCEPSNKSFESVFSGTRIFDFKINEKRNLGSKIITNLELEKYHLSKINTVHLLVMEPSSYEVEAFTSEDMTCRELEGKLWDDYYTKNIDYSKGRILAYHWKFKNGCSCLLKIKYSKTNIVALMGYIVMIVALGVVGSTIVSGIQDIFAEYFPLNAIVCGIVLFGIGLFLGKK